MKLRLLFARFMRFGFNSYEDYLYWDRIVQDIEYELSSLGAQCAAFPRVPISLDAGAFYSKVMG